MDGPRQLSAHGEVLEHLRVVHTHRTEHERAVCDGESGRRAQEWGIRLERGLGTAPQRRNGLEDRSEFITLTDTVFCSGTFVEATSHTHSSTQWASSMATSTVDVAVRSILFSARNCAFSGVKTTAHNNTCRGTPRLRRRHDFSTHRTLLAGARP